MKPPNGNQITFFAHKFVSLSFLALLSANAKSVQVIFPNLHTLLYTLNYKQNVI
jgi:hypothetical protein